VHPDPTEQPIPFGFTTADIAKRFRVGQDTVRGWIKRGELVAVNTRDVRCGRPRFVVLPEALAAFEQARQAVTPPGTRPARRRKRTSQIDFYPG
jgi:transposase